MASHRPIHRQPSFVKLPREELQEIARETLAAVQHGKYKADFGGAEHELADLSRIETSTTYFAPDALAHWATVTPPRTATPTTIVMYHNSTLEGVRFCLRTPLTGPPEPARRPAVLNFASATSPGGGFLYGARAQEETLARSSNLYSALASPTAAPFYAQHDTQREPRYSHAMLLARDVHFIRDDAGAWVAPAAADVLTSAAVNARAVREGLQRRGALPRGEEVELPEDVAAGLRAEMRERMARVLFALQLEGARDLVLGSFGTGAFGNEVKPVARMWAELLVGEGAHFRDVFRRVVFAVIDSGTYKEFWDVFREMGVVFTEGRGKE
ncbi:hypothetical protein C8R44DRAFT_682091 [Mycena epipterygia]|nr:hypothetical protein C8R44DRAFT_682091 [Mycena epipterygia]